MRELTVIETEQVGGGVAPLAVAVVNGVAAGVVYYKTSSNPNWVGATAAVTYGAVGGAIGAAGRLGSMVYGTAMGSAGSWIASRADANRASNHAH